MIAMLRKALIRRRLRGFSPEVIAATVTLMERGWNPAAPLNRGPDGMLYRKVRIPPGEWIWVRVSDESARVGIAGNSTAIATPAVAERDLVRFEIDEAGYGRIKETT